MAIKKGDRKARYLREDLDELQKSASGFDTVVAALELRFDKVAKSTETIKDRFEDHLNIGKKILANRENILKVDIQGEDLSGKISAHAAYLVALRMTTCSPRRPRGSGLVGCRACRYT